MKKFILFISILFLLCSYSTQAQVTITVPILSGLCVGTAAYTTLGDIVIDNETANSDINAGIGITLVLTMPTGFELEAGIGSASLAGGGSTAMNSISVLAGSVTVNYDAAFPQTTGITISGLKVRATAPAGAGNITYSATSTGVIVGVSAGTVMASLTSVALPTISVINTGTTVCAGKQTLFIATGNATQYRFEVMQGVTSIATQVYSATFIYSTPNTLTAGSYTMNVLGKNAAGCESVLSTTPFTVTSLPASPAITGGSTKNYCIGTNPATTINATGATTLRWFNDITLLNQVATGTSATLATLGVPTTASTTTFYLISDDGTCESAPTPLVVNITALPALTVFPSATTVCVGSTITFIASASGTGVQYEFVLKKATVLQVTQAYSATPFYTTSAILVAGNDYTMEVLAKDASGCISTLSNTPFVIEALPTAPTIASTTVSYCVGANLASSTLTATGITGGNTVEWFSDASLTTLMATGASVNVTTLGVSSASLNLYTRYFTQKNVNCRSAATLVTIQIALNPIVNIASNQPTSNQICDGAVINYAGFGPGGVTYSYTLNQIVPSLLLIQTTAFSATNTYTIPNNLIAGNRYHVTLTVMNGAGCQSSANGTLFEVLPAPTVVFNAPVPSSFLDSDTSPVTLTATPISGGSGTGVFSGPGVSGNLFYPNASGGAGSKIITYTFTGTNGCADSKTITLNVNTSGFFIGQGYCQDQAPTPLVTFGSCGAITGVNTASYSMPAASIQNPSVGVYNFVPSAMTIPAGQDFVQWSGAVFTPSCIAYYITTRVFRPATPAISSLGGATVCKDEIATYITPAHTFTNATGTVVYTWSFDTSGALVDGTILSGQGTNIIVVRWNNAGGAKLQVSQTINYTNPVATSCSKLAIFNVTINPLPSSTIAQAPNTPNICQGAIHTYSTDLIAGHTYNWTIINGTIISNPAPNNVITVQWNDAATGSAILGTVSLLRTITATGCQATTNSTRTLQPLPNPTLSVGNTAVCSEDVGKVYTVTPNTVGHTYTWSIIPAANGTIMTGAGTNSVTINWATVAVTTTTTLQLIQKNNATNCERTLSPTITINPLPISTITSTTGGGVNVCEDSEHTYQTPAGSFFYAWTVTNGTIVGASTADKVIVKWAGGVPTGTVNLTKTHISTGCVKTGSLVVNIIDLPNPLVTGASPICALSANVLYQTTAVVGNTYLWEVTDTNNSAVPFTVVGGNPHQIQVNWGATVSGRVKVTQTTATGCADSNSKNVAINPLPNPFILGAPEVCANAVGIKYITPPTGNNYAWTITGGTVVFGANANEFVVTWGATGAGTINLTETNPSTTCTKSTSLAVTIRPLPTPAITGATAVCQSQDSVAYSVPNVVGHKYKWSVIGGGIASASDTTNAITVNWGTGSTGKVEVRQKDATFSTNCITIASRNVTINTLPNPAIVGTTTVCAGASGQIYTTTAVTGHSYAWTIMGGTISAGAGTNTITVDWGANPTGAQVKLTQTDNNFATNCSKIVAQPIAIQPLPTPNIMPTTNTCIGSTVTYQTPLIGGAAYIWSVINGSITAGQGTNNLTVKWNDTGTSGSVRVDQTLSSCNNADIKTITFNPLPTPMVVGNAESCELSASPIIYTTANNAGSTYTWMVTGGTFTAGANPYEVNVSWGVNGTGTVRVTETNSNGCTNAHTKTVIINKLPNPDITPKAAVCVNSFSFYQITLNVGSTYVWSVSMNPGVNSNDLYPVSPNEVIILWGNASIATITVEETDIKGCKKTTTQSIVINAPPAPIVSGPLEVCENQTGVIYTVPSVSGNKYKWFLNGGNVIGSDTLNTVTVNWQNYAQTGGTGSISIEQTNTTTSCAGYNDDGLVTIHPLPNPIILGDTTVCANIMGEVYAVIDSVGHSYVWSITGGTIVAGQNTHSITVNWGSNPLGAQVSVTQTNNKFPTNCSKLVKRNIIIYPLPIPAITPNTAICEEAVSVLYQTASITGSTYVWEVTGGIFTSVAGNPNQILVTWGLANAVAGGVGKVKVTETNANSCIKVITQDILLQTKPNPTISPTTASCELSAYNTYQTANTGGSNFFWTVVGGVITDQNGSLITVQWNSLAQNIANGVTPNVKVLEVNANSCEKETSQNIILRALPAPVIAGNLSVCAFSTQMYSVPLVSGHSYVWTVAGGATIGNNTENTVLVAWGANPAFAKVQLEQIDNNFSPTTTCEKYIEIPITINPLPTPNITPIAAICEQTLGVAYQTPNNMNRTYVWSVIGGTIVSGQNTSNIIVNWGLSSVVLGVGKLKVVETNTLTTCKDSSLVDINLNLLPNPSISSTSTEVCELTVANTYQTANTSGSNFFWSVTGGIITGGQSTNQITVSWNATDVAGVASTRQVTVRETNVNGCIKAITQNITVNPRPVPAITGSYEVCAMQNDVIYTTPNVVGNEYVWSVVGATQVLNPTTNQITVNWGSVALGASLQVTETVTATGCTKITALPIIIRSLPTPVIIGDVAVCEQSAGKMYQVTPVANHSFVWSVTNPTQNVIVAGQGTNIITVNWGSVAGSDTIKVVQTDNNFATNCSTTKTLNINVLPLPTPTITGDFNVCASDTLLNTPNFYDITYTTPLAANSSYKWTVSNNGKIVSGQLTNQIRVRWTDPSLTTPLNTTTGTVTVLQETTAPTPFCLASDTKTVTIKPLPITNFNIANTCFGEVTTFTPAVIGAGWTWQWAFSEGSTLTSDTPSRTFLTLGAKTVNLVVTAPNGCQYKLNKTFVIHPVPVAKFSYTGSCLGGINTTQFTDLSTIALPDNITQWRWDFGDATPISTLQNPTHTYAIGNSYNVTLTVTTNNNCAHTYTQAVRIFPTEKPTVAIPYNQNFQAGKGGWLEGGINSTWAMGTPVAPRKILPTAGDIVWTTGLNANYINNQKSYVESPCFDLSALDKPMISFDMWSYTDIGGDGTTILYTTDDGITWKLLGKKGLGVNWYDVQNILGFDVNTSNPTREGWTGTQTAWESSRYNLDAVKAESVGKTVRFRVFFGSNSDNAVGTFDGFAFDDVFIGNRQTTALVEHFTSMLPSMQAENDIVNNLSMEAVKLQYHTNLADNSSFSDKMYKDNTTDPTSRALLYGLKTAPRASIGGIVNRDDAFSVWGLPEVDRQILGTPVFEMGINFLPTPADKLNIQVNVNPKIAYTEDIVLHIVLVEKEITTTQLGLTGTTIYKNVVKKMLPSAAGKAIRTDWIAGASQNFLETVTPYSLSQSTALAPKFYDWSKVKVVAFIQKFNTNEVLQAVEATPTFIPSPVTALADEGQGTCRIYPNPAQNEVFIGFDESAFRTYNWEILTLQGQSIAHGTIQKGEQGTNIDTQKYPSGMYIVKVSHPQNKAYWTGKLVVKK